MSQCGPLVCCLSSDTPRSLHALRVWHVAACQLHETQQTLAGGSNSGGTHVIAQVPDHRTKSWVSRRRRLARCELMCTRLVMQQVLRCLPAYQMHTPVAPKHLHQADDIRELPQHEADQWRPHITPDCMRVQTRCMSPQLTTSGLRAELLVLDSHWPPAGARKAHALPQECAPR